MTGMGMAIASGAPVAVAPLAASISWVGQSPYKAAGASGTCSPYNDGGTFYPNYVDVAVSGGTPPYNIVYSLPNQSSSKITYGANGSHTTLAWSGFAVGETQSTGLKIDVTDSTSPTPLHKSASIAGSVLINRVS